MAVAQRSAALRVTFLCARDYHGSKATSVLLPDPAERSAKCLVLVCGGETAHPINIAADDPTWEDTDDHAIDGDPASPGEH